MKNKELPVWAQKVLVFCFFTVFFLIVVPLHWIWHWTVSFFTGEFMDRRKWRAGKQVE